MSPNLPESNARALARYFSLWLAGGIFFTNVSVKALSKLHGVPSLSSASDVVIIKYLYINLRAADKKGALCMGSNKICLTLGEWLLVVEGE